MALEGRVAVVTGAASGIGLATVKRLTHCGVHVMAVDLDEEGLRAGLGAEERAQVASANVADSAQVDYVYDEARSRFGRVDIAVNAAGITGSQADIEDITDDDFRRVVEVNLYGTFYATRAAVRHMRRNDPAGGSIINISSVGALANFPLPAMYPASKAGVLGLTRSVAALVAPDDIRVNAVAPGAVDTPMLPSDPQARAAILRLGVLNRAASPDEVAATIAFLADDAESGFYTGQTLSPNGGYVMQ